MSGIDALRGIDRGLNIPDLRNHIKTNDTECVIPGAPGGDYLTDYSDRDRVWDQHKATADALALVLLSGGEEFERAARRVRACSGYLDFERTTDMETGESRLKLHRASFCRVRTCPICQWRRSLVNKARFIQKLPEVLAAHRGARCLFLTLTRQNCPVGDLKTTIKAMNQALRRMIQRKAWWPAIGWVKSVEVTRGADGSAHPHFHMVLLVPASYFAGRNYIKQAEWAAAWKRALKVTYDPIVDVRAIKPGQETEIAPELLKYATKPADLLADAEWFLEYARQVRGMRFIESGGVFRDLLKDDPDEEEMIHTSEDPEEEEIAGNGEMVRFQWDRPVKRYRRHRGESP